MFILLLWSERQRKLEARLAQSERDQAKQRMADVAASVLDKIAQEEVPTLPAAREEYVKLNLLRGEELCKLGRLPRNPQKATVNS